MRETVKRILTWSSPRANRNISEYGPKERNFFLVGMAGQNIIYALIGAALNMFYTDVLFVGTVTVAIVMAVSRFWDALNDMIMGTIVDRTHTRWGKCRPYLKYVPIPIAICTILLFLPLGGAPGWLKICYIVLSYLLWETLYTLGDIPLWGMTSLMTPDEKKRTKLISSARIVGSLSAIVIAFFAPLKDMFGKINMGIFPNTGKPNFTGYFSEAQGYLLAVSLIAILGGVMFSFVFPNVRERVVSNNSKEADTTFSQNLKIMFRNKPFLLAVLSMILGSTKNMVTTAGLYYCKWVLGNGSEGLWIIIFGAAFIGGLLVSMAISPYIGRRFGKKRVLITTSYLNAIPYVLIFFIGYKYVWLMISLLVIAGFLSGFANVYHTTLIADSVDYMELKVGKRSDGVFFSGLNFTSKLTGAITLFLSNALLSIVHYTDTISKLEADKAAIVAAGGTYALNFSGAFPDIAKMMLFLITIVPAIGCVLQAIPIHFYPLTEDKQKEILDELAIVRAQNKAEQEQNGEAN